ncbi:hypothetical protein [Helicobacter zhangjianzhongii]|uniref:Uncharacterized protein n=1 Tax=Helicobacter zhangjianzhongii TaxID=2974574 RepID=A0ACC6FV14_9HELI|nr:MULTISPECIES: hypothetical protein [unclassified Helicobacter]MDL0080622.1 hypothetical protein [Helicobacter sp. CPD2-1]MDL0082561.1 hypothetical protein [Helicobacter sp. XJK30-2]
MLCHAAHAARNDDKKALLLESTFLFAADFTQSAFFFFKDSRNCGGGFQKWILGVGRFL